MNSRISFDYLVGHYSRNETLWNVAAGPPGSIRFDAHKLHHLAPFLGFLGNELAKIGGRARQRDVMNLIVRDLPNNEIASILNLAEGLTAKECLQSAELCLALAHKTKVLDTRAALLAFAYEFRTVAKRLERDERKLMLRAASDGMQK